MAINICKKQLIDQILIIERMTQKLTKQEKLTFNLLGGREASISESCLPLPISRQLYSCACASLWLVGGASDDAQWAWFVCTVMSRGRLAPPFERLAVGK
ncbi:hypothetical protein EGW08_012474 [Elysia chlorotica]|uniref:Uncharacterized protein n=1 Tax=Elysia chlorotica TaxID=188477 RepID=A0A433TDV3_ELYCH|nr:hypothetical protein EGW08_012474 [Elysia chlorotica]